MLGVDRTVQNINGLKQALPVLQKLKALGASVKLGEYESVISPRTRTLECQHVPHVSDPGHYYTHLALSFLEGAGKVEGGVEGLVEIARRQKGLSMPAVLRRFADAEVPEYMDFDAVSREVSGLSERTLLRIGWFLRDETVKSEKAGTVKSLMARSRVTIDPHTLSFYSKMKNFRVMGFRTAGGVAVSRFGKAWPTDVLVRDGFGHQRDGYFYATGALNVDDIVQQGNGLILKLSASRSYEESYLLEEIRYVQVTTAPDPVVKR